MVIGPADFLGEGTRDTDFHTVAGVHEAIAAIVNPLDKHGDMVGNGNRFEVGRDGGKGPPCPIGICRHASPPSNGLRVQEQKIIGSDKEDLLGDFPNKFLADDDPTRIDF